MDPLSGANRLVEMSTSALTQRSSNEVMLSLNGLTARDVPMMITQSAWATSCGEISKNCGGNGSPYMLQMVTLATSIPARQSQPAIHDNRWLQKGTAFRLGAQRRRLLLAYELRDKLVDGYNGAARHALRARVAAVHCHALFLRQPGHDIQPVHILHTRCVSKIDVGSNLMKPTNQLSRK